MDTDISPVVGNWYRHLDKGEPFQVVAVDDAGNIEIAQFDGTVDEIAAQDWPGLEIEPCEAPADWSAPFDHLDPDQPGFAASDTTGGDWRAPVEEEPALLPPQAEEGGGAPPGAGPQQEENEPAGGLAEDTQAEPPGGLAPDAADSAAPPPARGAARAGVRRRGRSA